MEPQIRFCTSADGTRIAYATLGQGAPLLEVGGWGYSPELEWSRPNVRVSLEKIALGRLYVSVYRRGTGASQRQVEDLSLEAQVADLSAVIDHLGIKRFDLLGWVDGATVAIAYAAQNPEHVRRLVLWGPFAWGQDIVTLGLSSFVGLVHENWALARRAIADVMFPSGPTEAQLWLSDCLRQSVAPEMAAKFLQFQASVDLRDSLSQISVPTLVLARRGVKSIPIDAAKTVAAMIPQARFVALEGDAGHGYFGDTSYLSAIGEFLGEGEEAERATPVRPGGLRTILFTDMESSTSIARLFGDRRAQEVRRTHNQIVRDALQAHSGTEVKHTGDGIMASFATASSALDCAIAIQQGVAAHKEAHPDSPLGVYVGLNAGEPIAEEDDLFGTSVDLAARLVDHAQPGQIISSDVVRQLAAGKDFLFSDLGETELRGFEDPVKLWEVRWSEDE